MDFCHLHVHDQFSLLDAVAGTEALVDRASDLGMTALAITNHGNLFSHIKFYDYCKKKNIKPLIGVEAYIVKDHTVQDKDDKRSHLTLLAMNQQGYNNLLKLVSISYQKGFYYKPRMDWKLLEQYAEGIICLSGCLLSELNKFILAEDLDGARRWIERAQKIFGDRLYLEVTPVNYPDSKKAIPVVLQLAQEYGLPVVATGDVHYVQKEDVEIREVCWAIQDKKTVGDNTRRKDEVSEYYLKQGHEVLQGLLEYTTKEKGEKILEESQRIADRCHVEIGNADYIIANYTKEDHGPFFDLTLIVDECYHEKISQLHLSGTEEEKYFERYRYEMEVIKEMKLANYFLVVADVLRFCREQNIFAGPGRGSAAGSLICYLLGITKVDPIKYGLLFERFLNPGRKDSFPDIDTDIAHEDRPRVVEYLKQKYGENHVANIVTFGTMGPKASLKDAARYLELTFEQINEITKVIPVKIGGSPLQSLQQALDHVPELKKYQDQYPKLFDIALKLEDTPRHVSLHASAFLVTPEPIQNYAPLYYDARSKNIACGLDMYDCERLKILKFDFLGLKTLTVEEKCIQLIEQRHGIKINLDDVNFADPLVWSLFCRAETVGTFQTESEEMQNLLKKIRPENIQELSVVNAMDRPGPLNKGMDDLYAKRKRGEEALDVLDPSIQDILAPTYQTLVYQEQVMKIAEVFAGFSKSDADVLRKSMGKKKRELVLQMKQQFLDGAVSLGRPIETAEKLFNLIEEFSEYAFNMSHSLAYSMISYHTAYLKLYYPAEFMCAVLNVFKADQDETIKYLEECQRMGIQILPPDVNTSLTEWSVAGPKQLRYGFSSIRDFGEDMSEWLMQHRPFKDIYQFILTNDKINSKMLRALVFAGAFDSLYPHRESLLDFFEKEEIKKSRKKYQEESLFDMAEVFQQNVKMRLEKYGKRDFALAFKSMKEYEYIGMYLSAHPMDQLDKKLAMLSHTPIRTIVSQLDTLQNTSMTIIAVIESVSKTMSKKGNPMAFMDMFDRTGRMSVVVFPKQYDKLQGYLTAGRIVELTGAVSQNKILLNSMRTLFQPNYEQPLDKKPVNMVK